MQSKTVMNPSRLRILECFIQSGDATAAEIQTQLSDIPTASLYRHINILLEDGWLELVSERKVRGATERRYKLASTRANENYDMQVSDVLLSLLATFKAYFAEEDSDPVRDMLLVSTATLMLSDEEFEQFLIEQAELEQKYLGRQSDGKRKPRRLTYISSPCEQEEQNA